MPTPSTFDSILCVLQRCDVLVDDPSGFHVSCFEDVPVRSACHLHEPPDTLMTHHVLRQYGDELQTLYAVNNRFTLYIFSTGLSRLGTQH